MAKVECSLLVCRIVAVIVHLVSFACKCLPTVTWRMSSLHDSPCVSIILRPNNSKGYNQNTLSKCLTNRKKSMKSVLFAYLNKQNSFYTSHVNQTVGYNWIVNIKGLEYCWVFWMIDSSVNGRKVS